MVLPHKGRAQYGIDCHATIQGGRQFDARAGVDEGGGGLDLERHCR